MNLGMAFRLWADSGLRLYAGWVCRSSGCFTGLNIEWLKLNGVLAIANDIVNSEGLAQTFSKRRKT